MNPRTYALSAMAVALSTLMACSTIPTPNASLEQARSRYDNAQKNPQVGMLAPEELKRAGDSLRIADQAWSAGGKPSEVDHLAYLASQRVSIANDTASSKAAQAVVAGAGAERDRMRLALRTREAEQAQAALAGAQQANAQKSTELAAADSKLAARSSEVDAAQAALNQAQQSNEQKAAALAVAEAAALNDKARLDRRDARLGDLENQLKELNAKKTDRGMVVTLGDVLFDTGKAQLSAGGANLGKLAAFFQRNPDRRASIEGYTDSVGSDASNLELSGRRADAVMQALVGMGVPATNLSTQAHGEEMPAASNDTVAGRQMNRRVEIVFTPVAGEAVTK